jgi:hypothetical protein
VLQDGLGLLAPTVPPWIARGGAERKPWNRDHDSVPSQPQRGDPFSIRGRRRVAPLGPKPYLIETSLSRGCADAPPRAIDGGPVGAANRPLGLRIILWIIFAPGPAEAAGISNKTKCYLIRVVVFQIRRPEKHLLGVKRKGGSVDEKSKWPDILAHVTDRTKALAVICLVVDGLFLLSLPALEVSHRIYGVVVGGVILVVIAIGIVLIELRHTDANRIKANVDVQIATIRDENQKLVAKLQDELAMAKSDLQAKNRLIKELSKEAQRNETEVATLRVEKRYLEEKQKDLQKQLDELKKLDEELKDVSSLLKGMDAVEKKIKRSKDDIYGGDPEARKQKKLMLAEQAEKEKSGTSDQTAEKGS